MDYFSIVLHAIILATFVALYWKAGQIEDPQGNLLSFFWCLLSVSLFVATSYWLDWSYLGLILAQIALALAIALVRTIKSLLESRTKS